MPKTRKCIKNDSGFTLVELMVTVFLTAIAVISIYRGYTSFSQAADAQQQVMEMQQNLRIGMSRMIADIRKAGMNEEDEKLPATFEDAPTAFVPAQWRNRVLKKDGSVKRRDYEMCALSDLRDSLRSGAVWLEGSRQYANLESYLIPKARWEQLRSTYCDMVGIPEDGAVQLELKQAALEENLARLDKNLPKNEFVRFENGELVLSPLDKEEEEIRQEHPLAKKIGPLLPPIQLGQLLAEVDAWTGFSKLLTHAGGATSRIPDLATHLYAAVLTQACNMTLSGMAGAFGGLFSSPLVAMALVVEADVADGSTVGQGRQDLLEHDLFALIGFLLGRSAVTA